MHSVQTLQREHSNRRRRTFYLPYQPVSGIRATGKDVNCEQLSVEHYINIYYSYSIINNTIITSGVGCASLLETSTSVATTFERNSDIREFLCFVADETTGIANWEISALFCFSLLLFISVFCSLFKCFGKSQSQDFFID